MTEEEAKQRWCPFVRFTYAKKILVIPTGRALRRDDEGNPVHIEQFCIGSACMAWRWDNNPDVGSGIGFCGLAGKP